MRELWVEKYRPKTVSDYVFTDATVKEQIDGWIAEKAIPHLLFYGPAGTGKTSLAKVLINELGVDNFDVLYVNASRDNGIEFLRNKIEGFVSTLPYGDFKIVLLDEADYITPPAQGVLRGLMEAYSVHARFILTCNFVHKIIAPLKSRCHEIHINKTDQTEFTARVAQILITENIAFDIDTLDLYVRSKYPDLRKCINLVQSNIKDNILLAPSESESSTQDYRLVMVDLVKQGKIREARSLLCKQVRPEEMEEIFRWLYDNLELWSTTEEGQDEAIIIIRNGAANATLVADPEINLSACITELANINK